MFTIAVSFGNAQIAARLSISEKTVRNHVSNLFDKPGVWTRAQAIVFARNHGFDAIERRNFLRQQTCCRVEASLKAKALMFTAWKRSNCSKPPGLNKIFVENS